MRPSVINQEWVFEDGDWVFPDTPKKLVEQRIYDALNLWRGEWYLDVTQGIPYRQKLLGSRIDEIMLESIFRRALKAVDGVRDALLVDVNLDAERILHIRFEVLLDAGEVLQGEL